MTDILTLLSTALVTKLTANTPLVGLCNGEIWDATNTGKATDNYVIFQHVSGGDSNTSPRRDIDVQYRIEFVSMDLATARQGAGYIDDALHNQELSIEGWSNYRTERTQLFSRDEVLDGTLYRRRGGFYRFSLDMNS